MRTFNAAPSSDLSVRLTETVELGWEHTVSDGILTYATDSTGARVPRRITVPAHLTASDLMRASKVLPAEVSAKMERGEFDLEVTVELVGSLLGRDVIESIANDATVTTEALVGFVTWCLALWGVAGTAPGEADDAAPFDQTSLA